MCFLINCDYICADEGADEESKVERADIWRILILWYYAIRRMGLFPSKLSCITHLAAELHKFGLNIVFF